MSERNLKILVAAGSTGGHLFPAVAVVKELEKIANRSLEALFIGVDGKIESRIVPKLGYDFQSIPIVGYYGLKSPKTWSLPFKIFKSLKIARRAIRAFKPKCAICAGAYISYPVGLAAYKEKIPLVLMESNVNPGKTIKLLAPKANTILTSYEETANFFKEKERGKIFVSGNPVREDILKLPPQSKSRELFGLKPDKRTVLVFGGSLGAMSINKAIEKSLGYFQENDIQLIWQTGDKFEPKQEHVKGTIILKFIENMAAAYSAADLAVSRSGATTVAELTAAGKPSILIPYPYASTNEQEYNAKELTKKNAAVIIDNFKAKNELIKRIDELIKDEKRLKEMGEAAKNMGKADAAKISAKKIIDLIASKP